MAHHTSDFAVRLKANGQFEAYVADRRRVISDLEAALEVGPVVDVDEVGEGTVRLAHLRGKLWVEVDRAPYGAVASLSPFSDWTKTWDVTNFGAKSTDFAAQKHSLAYARGALKSELDKLARRTLAEIRAEVASLEKAA